MEHKDNQKVKRGEIYLYDFGNNEGSIQNGIRPVLIVQCDEGNQTSTTTVVARPYYGNQKTVFALAYYFGQKFRIG